MAIDRFILLRAGTNFGYKRGGRGAEDDGDSADCDQNANEKDGEEKLPLTSQPHRNIDRADAKLIRRILADIADGTIVRDKGISASALQIPYRIRYSRALRVIGCMEQMGYIGTQNGLRPREILYTCTGKSDY